MLLLICYRAPVLIRDQNIPSNPTELRDYAARLREDYGGLEAKHTDLEVRHKAEIMHRDMLITKLRHQLYGLRKDKFPAAKG